jgi:hypothetical protein
MDVNRGSSRRDAFFSRATDLAWNHRLLGLIRFTEKRSASKGPICRADRRRTWRTVVLSAGICLPEAEGDEVRRPAETAEPQASSSRNDARHHLGTVGEIM